MKTTRWRVSSYSGNQGNCAEVAFDVTQTRVRDTKNRNGGHLTVPPTAWRAFLAEVKDAR